MNKSAKGWRKERECRKLLEQEGWLIAFKSIRWRYGTLDFSGLFDTIALRKTIGGTDITAEWLFISNKHYSTQGKYKQHQEAIRQFKSLYGCSVMTFQLWLWHKPKWVGRGKNRQWQRAKWEVITL